MIQSFQDVLRAARNLPPEELRQLVDQLIGELRVSSLMEPLEARQQRARTAVDETFGSIKGVDQQTLTSLAEDEEYCGY